MSYTNHVIIIGTNHHNTLSMVRSFGEDGMSVFLLIYGVCKSYIAFSKYVEYVQYGSTVDDILETLKSICQKEVEKPVVIACSDDVSSKMDLRYEEFIHLCYFFNAGEKGRITNFMDKQIQLNLAEECGFKVPYSYETLPDDVVLDKIHLPCFIKPKESIHGGKNICVCKNFNEVENALLHYDSKYEILIQDYVEKEYEIVILGLSVNGTNYIPGFVQKHREAKGGTTYSTIRSIRELEHELIHSCEKLINEIGYSGLWGIECIKQGNNYYFLELNMRNDATTYSLVVAGFNLPLVFYKYCIGAEIPKYVSPIETIDSMVEFVDFNFVLKRQISYKVWKKQLKASKCRYFYSLEDKNPYKLYKIEYIKFLMRKLLNF